MAKNKSKYTMGTFWFLLIIIVSIVGSVMPSDVTIFWLILGICGAIVAITNIRIKEEISFLIGTSALLIIIISLFTLIPIVLPQLFILDMLTGQLTILGVFLVNLAVAFSVAGFIVALGLLVKLGIKK